MTARLRRSVAAAISRRLKGSGMRSREAWSQMAINRLWRDAAPRKHTRNQLIMSTDLRNGQRAQFSGRVKPRPPWLAERRRLNVEEVIGGS